MRLLIMGPPGAGKGTQAGLIAEHYKIPAISTGDIFRAMKTAQTPLADQLRAIMDSGGYVSDEITNAIVAARLAEPDCEHLRLVGQPGDRDREVEEQQKDEREGDEEERGGRVLDSYEPSCILQQPAEAGQDEQHDAAEQPQERVPLHEPPAPHELQHDQQQDPRRDDRQQLDSCFHQIPCSAATGAAPPGSGTGRARNRPTKIASSTLIM